MKVLSFTEEDLSVCGKSTACKVNSIHIRVSNVKNRAEDMISIISDTSWISKMDAIDKISYTARAARTIEKLVNDVFGHIESDVTAEFGEYMISDTAGLALQTVHQHVKYPLAELWKEKVTGNPGFDFHTESSSEFVFFGEAKYNSSSNPYSIAMKQIKNFRDLKKDESELTDLKKFASANAIQNALNNNRGYVIAFSINAKNARTIFDKAIACLEIDNLLDVPEIYLIGIEV